MSSNMNIRMRQHTNLGFTLIEIMVTLVVMTIGLLGLAGLQATAMQSNSGATLRTQAVIYANDMAERIRANPDAVTNNQFLNVTTAAINCGAAPPVPYCEEFWDVGAGVAVLPPAGGCTSNQLATFDINTWFCGGSRGGVNRSNSEGVNNQLPTSSATIVCTDNNLVDADLCSPGSSHTITINWRTRKEKGSDFDALDGPGGCLAAGDAATDCQSISLAIHP